MIPVHGPAYGALFAVAARLVRGEVEVSDEKGERLREAQHSVEALSDLVGDLSPTRPASWGRFAGRLMDRALGNPRQYESAVQAREVLGFDAPWPLPRALLQRLREYATWEMVYRDESRVMMVGEIDEGVELCVEMALSSNDAGALFYRSDEVTREAVRAAISTAVWSGQQGLYLDWARGGPTIKELGLEHYEYHGEKLRLIEQWRKFLAQDMRRSVLLHGPPGCGKTTFCCHAARELGRRTILTSPQAMIEVGLNEWSSLMELFEPDVLIVDDVDRIDSRRGYHLEAKLKLFEEGFCEVPVMLCTANDYTRVPGAMRRPGRIDRIVQFADPNDAVRRRVVERLAQRVGVEVPREQREGLFDVLERFSEAHVLEVLRRAKICGWEHARSWDGEFGFQREYDGPHDWLRVHGFEPFTVDAGFLIDELCRCVATEEVYVDEHHRLSALVLPNGARLCIEESDERSRILGGIAKVNYRPAIDGDQALREGIAQALWHRRRALLLDVVEDRKLAMSPLSVAERTYYGPKLANIEDWDKFRRRGLRRNILLQGPPGCGKSTFCLHAARTLSDRTLMLTPDFYDQVGAAQWTNIAEYLKPQMVIIDDVDRVGTRSLETKLRLFEEGYCDIPFVLFTSNDHQRLPAPMRRPGRIDQIIVFESPAKPLRWKLIREMATREGIEEVPDEHLESLDLVLRDQSTAHLVELLRRAKVLGWQEALEPEDGDITFGDRKAKKKVPAKRVM